MQPGTPTTTIEPEVVAPYPQWRAWYALVVLILQILLIGIDLAVVTLLVKPIETSLHLNDLDFANVTATPVAIGISLAYYPAGLLADTLRRRTTVSAGIVIWTLAALVAAHASSGGELFFARLLAGIGSGISGPSIFSLLTDAFTRSRRAFVYSIFLAGISLGSGVGLTFCAALVAAAQQRGTAVIGNVSLVSWQQAFVGIAMLGIVGFVLALTVREPPRRDRVRVADSSVASSITVFFRYLGRHGILWALLLFGFSVGGSIMSAIGTWAPTFGARRYGASELSAIALLGSLTSIGSLVGSVGGGFLAQRGINLSDYRSLPRLLTIVSVLSAVLSILFPYCPTWLFAVGAMSILTIFQVATSVLIPIAIQESAPNEVRGQLVGLSGIIGFVPSFLGATFVTYLSTQYFSQSGGLAPAFAVLGCATNVLAALSFAFCGGLYERAVKQVRAAEIALA